ATQPQSVEGSQPATELSSLVASPALPQRAFHAPASGSGPDAFAPLGSGEHHSYSDLSSLATSPPLPQSAFGNVLGDREGDSTTASSSVFHTPRTDGAGLGLTPVRSRSPSDSSPSPDA